MEVEMKRTVKKAVKWTAEEWEKVEKSAAAVGLTPSAYIRQCVLYRGK
jgi:hypothetical protein